MPRYMVRQRIERKILLDADGPDEANLIVFDRYRDDPEVKDPVARVSTHEDFDHAVAVKTGAFPAELEKL